MRRRIPLLIAGLALTAASACRDTPSAPGEEGLGYLQGEPAFARVGPVTQTVTIPAAGGTIQVGAFTVNFPANAVCDPNDPDNGYGPGTWYMPCTTVQGDFELTATFAYQKRRLWVDFSPSIRFDPSKTVTISTNAIPLKGAQASFRRNPAAFRFMAILYSPYIGARPVNDAQLNGDSSLLTHFDFSTNTISRRILHFSGYNIIYGYACKPSPDDPYCVEGDPPEGQ
jgi:hypothetical protein